MKPVVKQEILKTFGIRLQNRQLEAPKPLSLMDGASSSDSDFRFGDDFNGKRSRVFYNDDDDDEETVEGFGKRQRWDDDGGILPQGFLDPLPPEDALPLLMPEPISQFMSEEVTVPVRRCRQFWKAGDFEEEDCVKGDSKASTSAGMNHVRIHPKFLHSNATSHKWALGAFAELLDNALDEVCNGATFVNVDVLENKKDRSRMLLIEDNGGGMDPDRLRQCMSLGYSVKSKLANTIGQYGNGFKTSTMRLGADVIVFTRCRGKEAKSPTQSIGMLSYTFLRSTGKEDIVVPMLHYEKEGITWKKLMPQSPTDRERNVETIVRWSPYSSEADLFKQFNSMKDQGTCIIIYNLWEDEQRKLELDFSDQYDIQIRGVNRDETKIQMAEEFPNSKHFLTYRHSLRSYASILYLRRPHAFRIILRGKDIGHHNLVDDMMFKQKITYKPQGADGVSKDANLLAVVTIGFAKDARYRIDIQGFNVYHKNRLIKPFWRVWNAAGSGGRGVIGVLEADFVEPAHDKQGFERTTVLSRLETKLNLIQKTYWNHNRHKIGYASQRGKRLEYSHIVSSPELPRSSSVDYGAVSTGMENGTITPNFRNKSSSSQSRLRERSALTVDECADQALPSQNASQKDYFHSPSSFDGSVKENQAVDHISTSAHLKASNGTGNCQKPGLSKWDDCRIKHLEEENGEIRIRIKKLEESMLFQLRSERDKTKLLEAQLNEMVGKLEQANKEQEALIDIFSEERSRRDKEEENLRSKLKDSSIAIQELLERVAPNSNNVKLEG